MTTEEKFEAAVNVIRNLPKNGAYQPSNELQLRFYAYYKQATEGPCQQPKPAFWEVVKKAKWDAWMKVGNMSRHEAMNNYVEELKKIVETMSYTDNVANFLGSLESFYEHVPAEDLEMLVGPVIERIRSQPGSPLSGSPLGSRETSPHRSRKASRHITSSLETSPVSSHSASPLPPDTDGEEEDEFKDTVETAPDKIFKDCNSKSSISVPQASKLDQLSNLSNGHIVDHPVEFQHQERGRKKEKKTAAVTDENAEFLNHITNTLHNLQRDLDRITGRVRSLEGQALQSLTPKPKLAASWWPLNDCSPKIFAFIILWPFVAQFIINLIRNRPRNI